MSESKTPCMEKRCEYHAAYADQMKLEIKAVNDALAAALAERDALAARVAEAEKERDEWAAKWQTVRRELAELKYPGMTGVVRANDAALFREPQS